MTSSQPRSLSFLSFVIPVFNEEATIPYLREQLTAWLPSLGDIDYEIILVNDGSKDNSLELLEEWASQNTRIKVVSFSRNFGHQPAVSAGLRFVKGEACVIIDADLQDPLNTIHNMIERYEEGYDVAYGQRMARKGESFFKRGTAWLFYRVMDACMPVSLPLDSGDFRLVSRECLDAINAMPESNRFLRGLFAWAGFSQIAVPFSRDERRFGETKYPLRKMLSFAWNGITSFSTVPIKLVSCVGLLVALFSFLSGVWVLTSYLCGNTVQGWSSLAILLAFLGGMILIGIGIIGEYIGKIYEEVKARPAYIIQRKINMD